MSQFEFKLPDIGEGVAEGEVVAWHVEPGQQVKEDQEMVEVMTDKATVTIGCPCAGRVAQLNAEVGDRVPVGTVLVLIETADAAIQRRSEPPAQGGDTAVGNFQVPVGKQPGAREQALRVAEEHAVAGSKAPAAAKPPEDTTVASAVGDIREGLPGASLLQRALTAESAPTAAPGSSNGGPPAGRMAGAAGAVSVQPDQLDWFTDHPLATPATRKLARDMGLDLRKVRPSGPGGRVTRQDLLAHQSAQGTAATGAERRLDRSTAAPASAEDREERQPFVGLRRRIAERMQTAKQTAAHFTFVEECDVGRLKQLLARQRPAAEQEGLKLNYLPFIVKAVTLALRKHPMLNSMLDEQRNELVMRRYYHIGIAAATERGLVVPVLRDADQHNILGLAREIQRLGEGAREGRLGAAELSGSTFTITSLGKQGGLFATPVLNHPEVGILGVHQVKQKPVVRGGEIVVGDVMLLSLSLDHRIVDGHVGAAFAYEVIAYLEDPDRLVMELV